MTDCPWSRDLLKWLLQLLGMLLMQIGLILVQTFSLDFFLTTFDQFYPGKVSDDYYLDD